SDLFSISSITSSSVALFISSESYACCEYELTAKAWEIETITRIIVNRIILISSIKPWHNHDLRLCFFS
ncbi:MAG: hypothetical protein ACK5HT_10895, partial [Draconibacterium sp.]